MSFRTIRVWFPAALLTICATPLRADEAPSLHRHVSPILFQLGCSAGTCHGSFSGKGGFRLALFAGNTDLDYLNLRGGFGRRVDPLDPERSLLLQKPTGAVGHEGGVRLQKGSWKYKLIHDWIKAGAAYDPSREKKVVSVRTEPATLVLGIDKSAAPIKVIARLSDGKDEDVTKFTRFESLDPGLAEVDAAGVATGKRPGAIALLAHYAGEVAFTTALIPGAPVAGLEFPKEELRDRVDQLLVDRLKKLNIVPTPRCENLDFVRRTYLDTIGQLPTPDEVRAFLADTDPAKRSKLIDRLLEHPLHAALWAGKLCDMVGADDRFIGSGVYQFHDWFRNKLEANTPWDQIAKGVLVATTADGKTPDEIREDQKKEQEERKKAKMAGAAPPPKGKEPLPPGKKAWQTGYATRNTLDFFYSNLINTQQLPGKGRTVNSKQVALRVAHTFLGIQLECAQCHKHPYDRWSQGDYFSFSAVFAHVGMGPDPHLKAQKVNLSGVWASDTPVEEFLDPETQTPLPPRIPGGPKLTPKEGHDVRADLWAWMADKDNPFFASAIVNRVWDHYLGRGFVTPVDAQAAANPPSHPEVMKELTDDFIAHKFDLRHLERRVLNTLAYQRGWQTNASNATDDRNFSHRNLRRMTAEQALDALAQVTGTPLKFAKRFADLRDGDKAAEVASTRLGGDDAYVLQIFGRPLRVQNCDCERSGAASLSQTMYLFNDEKLIGKIHDDKGRLNSLVKSQADDGKLLEELYLWTLTRTPTAYEQERTLKYVASVGNRLEAFQDVYWSLINRHEFIVNR